MSKIEMPMCPNCGVAAVTKKRKIITGENLNNEWVWVCVNYPECDMYVGCHPGTFKPLGTLAGPRLRTLRWRVHKTMDTSWKSGKMTRNEVYKELASILEITTEEAHVGKLNEQQCEKIIKVFDDKKFWKTPKII